MISRKKVFLLRFINTVIFLFLISLQYNSSFSLKISNANPMLPLALLVAVAMFASEMTASISGLIVGIFIDSNASTPQGFHAVLFLLLGLFVSLTVRHLFNNNVFSSLALCAICGLLYFVTRWLFCYVSSSLTENLIYLMQIAFPSVVYTTAFIIPFYYLEKFLYNKLRY